MADSGYPKKGEIIHASDVARTFVKVDAYDFPTDLWTRYAKELVRRNDETVDALIYIDGFLDNSVPGSLLMTVATAKAHLQTLANEHHTHTSSDFTELNDWRIRTDASDTNDLVFGDRYHDKWYLVPDSKFMNNSNINSICYGNGKFVAVGSSGKMAYSYDGVNWTSVSDSKFGTTYIYNVCYGNGKFVAVGDGGKMAYSSDGITWTSVSDSEFNADTSIKGICYGNGKFVAVGYSTDMYNSGGRMSYSSDGITWTRVTDSRFGTSDILNVCYGNGKFVAVGSEARIVYSSDGVTWDTTVSSGIGLIYGVCYGNGKFVAVGSSGKIDYSSDGDTWTAVSDSKFGDSSINSVCYGDGKFVAAGYSGKISYAI